MQYRHLYYSSLLLAFATVAAAQIVLDPSPARVLGHPAITPAEQVNVYTISPNLGAGAGLYAPQGIALDTRGATPLLYVADTGNNRVLAYQNVTSKNPPAQLPSAIGQPNFYTTLPAISGGLSGPSGLLVDPSSGALYVADTGNNRVLRYPTPLGANPTPDLVLGQPDPFTSNQPNQGMSGPTANTLSLNNYVGTALAMDSTGLYVTDPGNRRVLHFPTASLTSGAYGPAADIVIGQSNFTTLAPPTGVLDRSHIYEPAGLAFDSTGRLFISDYAAGRILVFSPITSPAIRLAGVVLSGPSGVSASTLSGPQAIVMINNGPAVADSANNRILIFDQYSSPDWTLASGDTTYANPAPIAIAVLGQGASTASAMSFTTNGANLGNPQPAANTLDNPTAVAIAGTDLYVADTSNNRVLIFPMAAYSVPPVMGQAGSATQVLGQGAFPYNSANDFFYNSPNGIQGEEFFFGVNNVPIVLGGQLQNPQLIDAGIAVDQRSNPPHLYISDPNNNRVLGFADARKAGPGVLADLVLGEPDRNTAVCNYNGMPNAPALQPLQTPLQPSNSSLCYPTGLAVDASGNLYVADARNGRVLQFPAPFDTKNCARTPCYNEPAAVVLGQTGFTGIKNPTASQSVMVFPYGVAFDPAGDLLVSDLSVNRVLLFAKSNLVTGAGAALVFGQSDYASQDDTILNQPHHIAVDSNNMLYVTDSAAGAVQIFDISSGSSQAVNSLTNLAYPQAVWVNPSTVAGYQNDIWVGDENGLHRFPVPNPLGTGNTPTLQIPAATLQAGKSTLCAGPNPCGISALAITQDPYGNLYVADASNRVAIHYAAVAATNGASFACGGGCNLGTLNDPAFYLAPGALASLFPFYPVQFAVTATSNTVLPVPTTLAGVQVLINGQASPMFYVSPGQVNFVLPSSAPTSGTAQVEVVEPATSQILASGTLQMNSASLGFFTRPAGGAGQIAALNQDNTINSTSNPAMPNSVIQLFGTGEGFVPGQPPDGEPPKAGAQVPNPTTAYIGGSPATVQYSGLAPGYVGLWQVNIQIPQSPIALMGFPVNVFPVLVVYDGLSSNTPQNNSNPSLATTIAINAP